MRSKQIILVFLLLLTTFSPLSYAYAHPNCQLKYDSNKRSLPALRGMCNVCHIDPNGGGPTNEFGAAFKSAGFMITDDLIAKFPALFQQDNNPQASSSGVLKPIIKRIKPKAVKTNVQTMISIMGKNFVDGAKTFIDNNEAVTTFKSNVLLIVDFILDSVGTHDVKVQNPDEQESNTVKIKAK